MTRHRILVKIKFNLIAKSFKPLMAIIILQSFCHACVNSSNLDFTSLYSMHKKILILNFMPTYSVKPQGPVVSKAFSSKAWQILSKIYNFASCK